MQKTNSTEILKLAQSYFKKCPVCQIFPCFVFLFSLGHSVISLPTCWMQISSDINANCIIKIPWLLNTCVIFMHMSEYFAISFAEC